MQSQVLTPPIRQGIYPIAKPKGITSYDVIRQIKKMVHKEKIGHGGTLDPLATGVLVVAIGTQFTRQLQMILNGTTKEYIAVICLGKWSETDDAQGPLHTIPVTSTPTKKQINEVLKKFVGTIEQKPPIFSAVKIQGTPAYKRARAGEHIEMKSKTVVIDEITLLSFDYPYLTCKITCGSGVYIRSLAADIGQVLGCGGYVSELQRTRVGAYTLDASFSLDYF